MTPLERLDTAIMDAIEHNPKKTLQALTGAFERCDEWLSAALSSVGGTKKACSCLD